ncbi:hypothetical protein [Streptomyces caniscabiei]|uniref:hypothetical protein n=1 Tax=Streptomyces caniscabiei TaxID=2746961 RepID=UPI0038F7DBA8
MSSQIQRLVDDLVAQMGSGSESYQGTLEKLADAARNDGPDSLTVVVESLAPLLPGLAGDYATVAVLAGACVEWGGSPMALVDVLPQRAAEAMMLNAAVPDLWSKATGGRPLPEPSSASADLLVRGLTQRAWWRRGRRADGMREEAMTRIAMSWFDMDYWLSALTAVMVDTRFRAAVADDVKDELRRYASAVVARSQEAAWVQALAAVLDDEPLIVIDSSVRRAYALRMSGLADMGQLYILLADRLIGDSDEPLVAGERPLSRWTEAATDGPPSLGQDEPAKLAFRLFDAHGAYFGPERLPADIKRVHGTRLLILQPPNGTVLLGAGRMFERMTPTLLLDRVLRPEETQSWLNRLSMSQ